ncbi:hypothetical protein SAMN02745127_02030 [Oceanospirillum multiglobuliferum]|uniref:GNAT family N-acetyltransferase n=1 Tax=Oceanospirillum multiglobuliferum TaxID=64969 RepID=A0A1T4QVD0_9GAMM|nr:GNAT family N-acetyltransferase [Oceanospirillum multiglobuliferum]OPX57101.1 hypothetical protein BTE48_01350 [Oceanospirillum multiglobuliferum]SKA07729.1 hypothetical protein SAMN02745127_02030 [Oceanospirillum multiglobuliferum]
MQLRVLQQLSELSPSQWSQLQLTGNPFLNPVFLTALEHTSVVGGDTGWQPCHLLLEDAQGIAALMPTYVKYHSYGEYVFDWVWAEAYESQHLEYYPKLVSAIPYTPSEGSRVLLRIDYSFEQVLPHFLAGIQQLVRQYKLSSWHLLFPDQHSYQQGLKQNLLGRTSCQYHWQNTEGWQDFEQFLNSFSAKKRKNVRQERRKIVDQGIKLRRVRGAEISQSQLRHFYQCYQTTYQQRGRQGYLNMDFFQYLVEQMPEKIMLVEAYIKDELEQNCSIAAALFFYDQSRLYGRYWGSRADVDCLHFEVCYYQGIEFCLEQGLTHFDPGTQGEHKVARGFSPYLTHSNHWIAEPLFSQTIQQWLKSEQQQIEAYAQAIDLKTPFRK